MTQAELTDYLTYISVRQMLAQLLERKLLTGDEVDAAEKELRRQIRLSNDFFQQD